MQKMMKMFHDTYDTLVASISFVCLDKIEIDNRSFRGFVEEFNERLQALPTATKRNTAKPVDIADTDFPTAVHVCS